MLEIVVSAWQNGSRLVLDQGRVLSDGQPEISVAFPVLDERYMVSEAARPLPCMCSPGTDPHHLAYPVTSNILLHGRWNGFLYLGQSLIQSLLFTTMHLMPDLKILFPPSKLFVEACRRDVLKGRVDLKPAGV